MPKKKPIQPSTPPEDPLVAAAWKFQDDNPELSRLPSGMAIQFLPSGTSALKMTVTIPENLTRTGYLRAWPTINRWRQRLTTFIGRHDFTPREQLLRQLAAKHPQRSYAKLADEMNQRIETLLRIMLRADKTKDKNQFLMAGYLLQRNLRALHVKPDDLRQPGTALTRKILETWILECCQRLAKGHPAFDGYPPIKREHLVQCLRPYRKR